MRRPDCRFLAPNVLRRGPAVTHRFVNGRGHVARDERRLNATIPAPAHTGADQNVGETLLAGVTDQRSLHPGGDLAARRLAVHHRQPLDRSEPLDRSHNRVLGARLRSPLRPGPGRPDRGFPPRQAGARAQPGSARIPPQQRRVGLAAGMPG